MKMYTKEPSIRPIIKHLHHMQKCIFQHQNLPTISTTPYRPRRQKLYHLPHSTNEFAGMEDFCDLNKCNYWIE